MPDIYKKINHHLYLYIWKTRVFLFLIKKLYFHQLFLLLPCYLLFIYLFIYLFKFENDVFFMAQAYSAEKENKSAPITNRT